jgi:hypothetical protein
VIEILGITFTIIKWLIALALVPVVLGVAFGLLVMVIKIVRGIPELVTYLIDIVLLFLIILVELLDMLLKLPRTILKKVKSNDS